MPVDPVGPDATPERSAEPCPVCGHHDLTLDQPPHLTVAGVQPYTDLYMMGDLPMPPGVRCAFCGTKWVSIEALRAGEPSPPEVEPPPDLIVEDDVAPDAEVPLAAPGTRRATSGPDLVDTIILVVAVAAGIVLLATGLIWLVMIPVIAVVLLAGRRRGRGQGS